MLSRERWMVALAAGSCAALLCVSVPAIRASEVGCGVVYQCLCAGCTPSAPSDSGCQCGRNQAATDCDCLNTGGALQSGSIVTCNTNNFCWNPEPPTYKIFSTDPVPCGEAKRCQTGGGSQTHCAVLMNGRCAQLPTACSWVPVTTYASPLYSQGDLCE